MSHASFLHEHIICRDEIRFYGLVFRFNALLRQTMSDESSNFAPKVRTNYFNKRTVMKNFKTLVLSLMAVALCAFGQTAKAVEPAAQPAEGQAGKVLVTYVSFSGTTERVANKLAKVLSADIVKLEPEKAYTSADLDWRNKNSRCNEEHNNPSMRPALKTKISNLADYDVIYLGYPIWWNLAPQLLKTFLDQNDLSGKKVVPFATSGSSSIDNSEADLKKSYPNINWQPGKRLTSGTSDSELQKWTATIQ